MKIKTHKWTLALAAAGVVSLPSLANAQEAAPEDGWPEKGMSSDGGRTCFRQKLDQNSLRACALPNILAIPTIWTGPEAESGPPRKLKV